MSSEVIAAASDPYPLLEVHHVARKLGYGPDHVRQLIRDGKLRGIRFGRRWRIDPSDLKAYIDRHRTQEPDRRRTSTPGLFPLAATP